VKFDELKGILKTIGTFFIILIYENCILIYFFTIFDKESHKTLRRRLGKVIFNKHKSCRGKIVRKIRNAYYSLYLKEGFVITNTYSSF
jgi:hypothetical protein